MCVGVLNVARALAPELEFQLQHAAGNAIERLARSAAFMAHAIGMQYMWLAWRGVGARAGSRSVVDLDETAEGCVPAPFDR